MTTPREGLRLRYDAVDTRYLDCLADNLAVLLFNLGVDDPLAPFAAQWYFSFDASSPQPVVSLERIPILDTIFAQTGCRIHQHRFADHLYTETCLPHLAAGHPVLLFGDAYAMPWLPYYQNTHLEHTFIVDTIDLDRDCLHIVDAYHNKTGWGEALPTDTNIDSKTVCEAVSSLRSPQFQTYLIVKRELPPAPIDLERIARDNARAIVAHLDERHDGDAFVRYYRDQVQDLEAVRTFVLECWRLARTRMLHALWLRPRAITDDSGPSEQWVHLFMTEVARGWQRVSELAYILSRRVAQGRTPPLTAFDLITDAVLPAEVRAARKLLETLDPPPAGRRGSS